MRGTVPELPTARGDEAVPRRPSSGRALELAWVGVGLAAIAAGIRSAFVLVAVLDAQDGLPLADMAKNAWLGLQLARDLRALAPLDFLLDLNAHSTWSFGFSLLLVPGFLALGESFRTAALASTACYALVPAAIVALARRVDSGLTGVGAGLLAALLFLASPLPALLAILVLRETAGSLFLLVAAGLYLRACERNSLTSWRVAALAALWLFFVKYNYALLLLPAIALDRALALPRSELRTLLRRVADALRRWRRWSALERSVALSLLLLAAALASGRGAGGVLFGLLVLWSGALVLRFRTLGRRALERVRELPPPGRAAIETFVAPIWLWCLVPSPMHARGLLEFLENRTSALAPLAGAGLYARGFVERLVPGAWLGAAVAAGAVGALFVLRGSPRLRFLALLSATSLLLPLAHPYKQERFLVTGLAPLLLLAAFGWTKLAAHGARRLRVPWLAAVALLVAGGSLLRTLEIPAVKFAAAHYLDWSAPSEMGRALKALANLAPRRRPIALLGTFNALSRELVLWHLTFRHDREPNLVPLPSRFPPDAPNAEVVEAVKSWVARRRPEAILAIRLPPGSPLRHDDDYLRFSLWQTRVSETLTSDPEWSEVARRRIRDPDLVVVLLARRPSPPEAR